MGFLDLFKKSNAKIEIEERNQDEVYIWTEGKAKLLSGHHSENGEFAVGTGEGEVILTHNDGVLWRKKLGKPGECSVSDNGRVAVNDVRELYVFERDGSEIFFKKFDTPKYEFTEWEAKNWSAERKEGFISEWEKSAGVLEKCAISVDGTKLAATITGAFKTGEFKTGELYVFDLKSKETLLSRKKPTKGIDFLEIADEVVYLNIYNREAASEVCNSSGDYDFIVDIKTGKTVGGKRREILEEFRKIYGKRK